jgi:cell division control protein 24
VTKSEVDREYHVFLFEKIILCCKEALLPPAEQQAKGWQEQLAPEEAVSACPFVIARRTWTAKKKKHTFITEGPHFLEQCHAGCTHVTSTINL